MTARMDDYHREHPASGIDELLGDASKAPVAVDDVLRVARLLWPELRIEDGRPRFDLAEWDALIEQAGPSVDSYRAATADDASIDPASITFVPFGRLLADLGIDERAEKVGGLIRRGWRERMYDHHMPERMNLKSWPAPDGTPGIVFFARDSVVLTSGDAAHVEVGFAFSRPAALPDDFDTTGVGDQNLLLGRALGWAAHDHDPDEPHQTPKSALFSLGDLRAFRDELSHAIEAGEGLAWLTSFPGSASPTVYFSEDEHGGGGSSWSGSPVAIPDPITTPSAMKLSVLLRPSGQVLWKYEWNAGSGSGDSNGSGTDRLVQRLIEQADKLLGEFPIDGDPAVSPRPELRVGSNSPAIIESGKVWPSLDDDDPVFG